MTDVMDRLRQAAARAACGPLADAVERPSFATVAAESPFAPDASLEDRVARFRSELEVVGGKVYGPFDAEGVAETVAGLVPARSLLLAWDPGQVSCPGLLDRLTEASIEIVPGEVPNDLGHQATVERLAEIPVGLTGAVAGLADTGSLVVASGPGQGRVASLLPPVHVAVLPVSRLHPTMADWLAGGGADLVRGSANVVAITGPSRTADIELSLTIGVHGPKELHVVLLA